ncbi:MAG: tripartite tricarboxylate transporter TctB family protein [Rhodospirillales bacterium]
MPSVATVEIAVASVLVAFGAVVMWDSARIGAGWAADGPAAGYFPFYIGLLIVLGSLVNLGRAAMARRALADPIAGRAQFRSVLAMLLPAIVFVGLIDLVGLYVAAALYIASLMRWLGGYRWPTIAAVSIGVPVVAFVTFEIWFLVALPKGPVEEMLGF